MNKFFNPFYILSQKPKSIIGKLLVSFWFLGHFVLISVYLILAVVLVNDTIKKFKNSRLSDSEIGRIIKQEYPEYKDLSDEKVGNLYLNKYKDKNLNTPEKTIVIRDKKTGETKEIKQNELADYGLPEINNLFLDIQTNWTDNILQIFLITVGLEIFFVLSNWIELSLYKIWE